ncbi:MAG: transglycosylase SLT domain-containing protein [Gammaproteobacteria bacterium]
MTWSKAWNATLQRRAVWLAVVLASRALAQPAATDEPQGVRAEFREAYTAAQLGLTSKETDTPALEAYALYAYVQAARLAYVLQHAPAGASEADRFTEDFLSAHGREPVTAPLRRAWLESLARRGEWAQLLDHYDAASTSDTLACAQLNARIALQQTAGLETAITERWLAPYKLPAECEPVFQWLRENGGIDDALVAERARRLLGNGQAGFARVVAQRLPRAQAAPLLRWADLIEKPRESIDALIADPTAGVETKQLLDAFARLARNAPRDALARFDVLRRTRLTSVEAASKASRALALGLAWNRDPEALTQFADVASADLDDDALEWLVRAALWKQDWSAARSGVALMSASRQKDPAWRYWTGRAAEATGDEALAHERYASLAPDDNYYSAMAAARVGKRVEPHIEKLPVDEQAIGRIVQGAPFVRAHELLLCGLRPLATLEWNAGYAALENALKPQAVPLAARWGLHDIAVATATSQGVFKDYALLYPRPFRKEVTAAAGLTRVEEPLLYGVLRQESLFRPDATSLAGAVGLAQLGYSTAEITASRWQLPRPSRADLYDPETSIRLGAARLATLIEKYSGQVPVVLAAYNAGESAAERWLPERAMDGDIWTENIPYNETRAYVRRVLWHSLVFEWIEDGHPKSTKSWLGSVSKGE